MIPRLTDLHVILLVEVGLYSTNGTLEADLEEYQKPEVTIDETVR